MRAVMMTVAALTLLTPCVGAQPTVTIEKVVRSSGNSIYHRDMTLTDPVPGRDFPFVFWSSAAEPPAPVINEGGEVVFKGFNASRFGINTGGEFGLYVKRPGESLAVLVDTTLDGAGNPSFAVPGHPNARFRSFDPALINDAGDVVFWARFTDLTTFASGTGFFSTTTTGGPIVGIVDTSDPVAGHPASAKFESFTFVVNRPATFGASLNDLGQVVYWGQFCDSPPCTSSTRRNGIFGTTVSGAAHVLLADSSKKICPIGNPLGVTCDPILDQGFAEIRPEKGINRGGDVAFHGRIRNTLSGTYSVHVTGGPITTVAFRSQLAPPGGAASYRDRFDNVELNDSGTYLFQPLLSAPCCFQRFGHFAGHVAGGPHTRIVDTLDGNGIGVPGEIAGAQFISIASVSINESGQMGFYASIRNGAIPNNNGIYAADSTGGPIRLVMDGGSTAPGLPAPARISSFQGGSAAINDGGNMAFWGLGLDDQGAALRGLYFYDGCADQVVRIADSTTVLADLGIAFGGFPGNSFFDLHQGGEARSGQYRSINNAGEVAFLAKFSNFGMGLYIARVDAGGGGAVTIECPADVTLECPADTSPAATGEATADGCGDVDVSYADLSLPGPGGTETITRTWTAAGGAGGTASCEQTIIVADTAAPAVSCAVATEILWPPNHELATVGLSTDVADGCDDPGAAGSLEVQVWSDETEVPEPGDGTGRHAPDAKDVDLRLRLRRERRGTEDGRVYLILARAEDGSGNAGLGTCTVVVPHDQSAAGLAAVAAEAAAAEAAVASAPGTTIADKVAPLAAQGWTRHGISEEIGPKQ